VYEVVYLVARITQCYLHLYGLHVGARA